MKSKFTNGLLMSALIGSLMGISAEAFAAELQEFALDTMVVTATRTEKRDVEVPASTTVLTNKDLQRTGAQDRFEFFGRVTTGLAYKSFGPGGLTTVNHG